MLEPLFVKDGVSVVLAGHDHFYERIKPQKGHPLLRGGGGRVAAQGRHPEHRTHRRRVRPGLPLHDDGDRRRRDALPGHQPHGRDGGLGRVRRPGAALVTPAPPGPRRGGEPAPAPSPCRLPRRGSAFARASRRPEQMRRARRGTAAPASRPGWAYASREQPLGSEGLSSSKWLDPAGASPVSRPSTTLQGVGGADDEVRGRRRPQPPAYAAALSFEGAHRARSHGHHAAPAGAASCDRRRPSAPGSRTAPAAAGARRAPRRRSRRGRRRG